MIVSSWYNILFFVFLLRPFFVCGQFRRAKHIRLNRDNKLNHDCQYVVSSYRYFSHYRVIKCVSFTPIQYAINPDVVSSSMILAKLILYFYRYITSLIQ